MKQHEIFPDGNFESCENHDELTDWMVNDIIDEFSAKGLTVGFDAIKHNYMAWCADEKSGYKDEQNGTFLFTPCGCNRLSLTASELTGANWEKTYTA